MRPAKRRGVLMATEAAAAEAPAIAPTATWRTWALVVALMLAYALNAMDRHLLSVLAEDVRRDLGLTDSQIGLIAGLGFSGVYFLAALPWGWMSDRPRVSRVWVISSAVALWSAMTAACGLAQNALQLALGRMGVAAGEAGCSPPAQSLIAQTVPAAQLARALAIFGLGLPIGAMLGRSLGGALSEEIGWRGAFVALGLPGVLLALVMVLAFKDRARTGPGRGGPAGSVADAARAILRSKAILSIMAGNILMGGLMAGVGFWTIVHFQRNLGLSAGEAGLWLGLQSGVTGIAGVLIGGWFADRLARQSPRHYLTPAVAGMLLAPPLFVIAWASDLWWVTLLLILIPTMADNLCFGGSNAATQRLLPPHTRGAATSLIGMTVMLVGPGVGVTLFGVASDWVQGLLPQGSEPAESIRWVLLASAFGFLAPAWFYWRAGRAAARELAAA